MIVRRMTAALCMLLPGLAAAGTLTGSAYYLERIALPPEAVLEVVVLDVSLADAPAKTLGRTTMEPAGQVPIAFQVHYDDAAGSHLTDTPCAPRPMRGGSSSSGSPRAPLFRTGPSKARAGN